MRKEGRQATLLLSVRLSGSEPIRSLDLRGTAIACKVSHAVAFEAPLH